MAKRQRVAVRFDEQVWSEAIRGFSGRPLQIATSARAQLERDGVALASLLPCEVLGPDRAARQRPPRGFGDLATLAATSPADRSLVEPADAVAEPGRVPLSDPLQAVGDVGS